MRGETFERALIQAFVAVIKDRGEKHDPVARRAWPEMSDAARAWRRVRKGERSMPLSEAFDMSKALELDFAAVVWNVMQALSRVEAERLQGYGQVRESMPWAKVLQLPRVAEEPGSYGTGKGRVVLHGADTLHVRSAHDLQKVTPLPGALAVPVVDMETAAKRAPIAHKEILSWVLVWPAPSGDNLVVVAAPDNSMAPGLHAGDMLFLDLAVPEPQIPDGEIWLVRLDGELALRRARRSKDGRNVIFYADDPTAAQPDSRSMAEAADVFIGRAVLDVPEPRE
jgi:hypothetical protein